ncbi:hypothetical protein ABZ815_19855 [Nonomuraea sp. NPDC047529]|uniref:hypothetical protein n=1 Tax=Nonomuraea sp. NPDC047529 TaxID=3155623 RepID=UPI0033CF1384
MGTESALCPVCQGVLPASGREAYTPLRGRLIVTNGYCAGGHAEGRAEAAQVEQVEQTRQVARPMPAHSVAQPVVQGVVAPVPMGRR